MAKLLVMLAVLIVAWRLLVGRWPWDRSSQRDRLQAARARAILGVRKGASREEIIEAHRQLIVRVHPDRGGSNGQVHDANEARDLLLQQSSSRQERL